MDIVHDKPAVAGVDKPLSKFEQDLLRLVVIEGVKPTEAVRRLDPECKRPDVKASKITAKPQWKAARQKIEDDALSNAGVSKAWIANQLRKIASARMLGPGGRLLRLHELDEDTLSVLSVEYEEEAQKGSDEETQLPLLDESGQPIVEPGVPLRRLKVKQWSVPEALKELASLAGMKKQDALSDLDRIGPGLTVIVQQAVQVQAGHASPASPGTAHRVTVQLPRPSRS